MINQKGEITILLIMLIVLVVLAAIGAIFFLKSSNVPPETELNVAKKKSTEATWNVYRNDKNGFEIKYPKTCSPNDTYFNNQYAFGLAITSSSWKNSGGVVAVINHGNVGTNTLKQFVEKLYPPDFKLTLTEEKVNNYDAIKAAGQNKISYFMFRDLDVYEVYKSGAEMPKQMDDIIKTFKFLD